MLWYPTVIKKLIDRLILYLAAPHRHNPAIALSYISWQ